MKNAGDSYNQYQSLAVPIPEFKPVVGDTSRSCSNYNLSIIMFEFYIIGPLLGDLSGRYYW